MAWCMDAIGGLVVIPSLLMAAMCLFDIHSRPKQYAGESIRSTMDQATSFIRKGFSASTHLSPIMTPVREEVGDRCTPLIRCRVLTLRSKILNGRGAETAVGYRWSAVAIFLSQCP